MITLSLRCFPCIKTNLNLLSPLRCNKTFFRLLKLLIGDSVPTRIDFDLDQCQTKMLSRPASLIITNLSIKTTLKCFYHFIVVGRVKFLRFTMSFKLKQLKMFLLLHCSRTSTFFGHYQVFKTDEI